MSQKESIKSAAILFLLAVCMFLFVQLMAHRVPPQVDNSLELKLLRAEIEHHEEMEMIRAMPTWAPVMDE